MKTKLLIIQLLVILSIFLLPVHAEKTPFSLDYQNEYITVIDIAELHNFEIVVTASGSNDYNILVYPVDSPSSSGGCGTVLSEKVTPGNTVKVNANAYSVLICSSRNLKSDDGVLTGTYEITDNGVTVTSTESGLDFPIIPFLGLFIAIFIEQTIRKKIKK